MYLLKDVYQIKGKVKKINATDSTTLHPLSAAASPCCPSAAAMIIAGMMATERVRKRRRRGLIRQSMAPSQINLIFRIRYVSPRIRKHWGNVSSNMKHKPLDD